MKNKQLIKAMYVLAITFLLCPCMCFGKTKSTRSTPGTAIFVMTQPSSSMTVESKQLSYKNHDLKLNIKVPQITEEKNDIFSKNFNKEMLSKSKKHKQEIIALAKSSNKDLKKDGLNSICFECLEDFSPVETMDSYYTLAFFKYQYNGGAHGISEIDYLTVDLKNRQIMELGDFFNNKLDYKLILDKIIKEQIRVRNAVNEEFFYPTEGVCLIKDNHPFFFSADGDLTLVFNTYEIAPYSSGIIYFTIARDTLLPYMK